MADFFQTRHTSSSTKILFYCACHPWAELIRPRRIGEYREVQLDITPDMEVFHMMFERFHTNKRAMTYIDLWRSAFLIVLTHGTFIHI